MAGTNIHGKSPAWYTGGLAASLRPGANRGDVIYLDGNAGDDANLGLRPDQPVESFKQALVLCTDWMDDTIVVLDYWQNANDTWPIDVNKNTVHIIGVHGQGATKVQVNPPAGPDTACFEINAESVEISYLSCNAGVSHAGIEWAAAEWGAEIHHCWFGELGTAQDGIRNDGAVDAVYAKIWACRFGLGLTRDGVRIEHNMTRGMIGVPGLEPNWFRGVPGVAINIINQFAQGGIFDNRIAMPANTLGGGVDIALGATGIHIDGNSATYGDTGAGNNPYQDLNVADQNTWGANTHGPALTAPA